MSDLTLQDGSEININKRAITRKEWRKLFDPAQSDEEANEILSKLIGKPINYVDELSLNDFQLVIEAAIKKVNAPPDPNSPSVSTGQS